MKRKFKQWWSSIPPTQYQQNAQSPLTLSHWTQKKRPWQLMLKIEVLAWDRHKKCSAHSNGYFSNSVCWILFWKITVDLKSCYYQIANDQLSFTDQSNHQIILLTLSGDGFSIFSKALTHNNFPEKVTTAFGTQLWSINDGLKVS